MRNDLLFGLSKNAILPLRMLIMTFSICICIMNSVYAQESTGKSCGKCGRSVPATSLAGQSCPHCGAYWSFENGVTPSIKQNKPQIQTPIKRLTLQESKDRLKLVTLLGSIPLLIGLATFRSRWSFYKRAVKTEGHVQSIQRSTDVVIITYQRPVNVHPSMGTSTVQMWESELRLCGRQYVAMYREGQVVEVLYDPFATSWARVDSFSSVFGLPVVMLCCGIIWLIVGTIVWLLL